MSLKFKIFSSMLVIIILTVISSAIFFNIGIERHFSQFRLEESAQEIDQFLQRAEKLYQQTDDRAQVIDFISVYAEENNIDYFPGAPDNQHHQHGNNRSTSAERSSRMMERGHQGMMRDILEDGLVLEFSGEHFGYLNWSQSPEEAGLLQEIEAQTADLRNNINRFLFPIGAILIFLSGLLSFGLAKRHTQPIAAMIKTVEKIEQGEFQVKISDCDTPELQSLADAINSLSSRLSYLEQVRRQSVSDISHEMRTPLTNLKNYLHALDDNVLEWDEETLEELEEEVDRLINLTEKFEELTEAERKAKNIELSRQNLTEVFRGLKKKFSNRAKQKNISLNFTVSLDKLVWQLDEEAVKTILINLLNNSIKYTEPGGKIRCSVKRNEEMLEFNVSDTGIGIPDSEQEMIFERFYRTDKSRSRDTGGSGLGLAIVKELVEAMKGSINIESEEGTGTVISVLIPAIKEEK